ncbi:hypothetical protein ABR737_01620 [Streptomyces sp. Edi2]|uniref:hypothetical protein n=1 Tax=Streptomyces sp. Edi2 TaxID=3162528 RepID=UPI0033065BC8
MARTWHHRPDRVQATDRRAGHRGRFAGEGGRTGHQKAAHKRDRAAVRHALRTGGEAPRSQRRRVDRDAH